MSNEIRLRSAMVYLFGFFLLSTDAAAADSLKIWTRMPGNYASAHEIKPGNPKSIDLKSLKTTKSKRLRLKDVQYRQTLSYQALKLGDLLDGYVPSDAQVDAVLLHFKNGMKVSLPLDSNVKDKLYIALGVCESKKKCEAKFPSLAKEDPLVSRDPRPIQFAGNKLVSTTLAHPYVSPSSNFSPWNHTDSLTGIEFVRERSYFAQFDSGGHEGSAVYKRRCSYCHGVQNVGASFGWDYVDPLPVYKIKTPQNLLFHTKYPKAHALNMGLFMPNQKDINAKEATALWGWMKKLATTPIKAYVKP